MITADDTIYFLMTDRFRDGNPINNTGVEKNNPKRYHGGDFAGIKKSIPYFKKLGITAIWITPVYLNIKEGSTDPYHGYWTLCFDDVDPHLYTKSPESNQNTKSYLKDLVDILHGENIKVILDMVVNHCGKEAKANWPQYFFQDGSGDFEMPLSGLPDFDHDIKNVVDFFVNNTLDWIEETGIDGIRMDTAKHVEKYFWYAFKAQVRCKHPHITLIGEVLKSGYEDVEEIATYQSLDDFDSLFDFPLRTTIINCFIYDHSLREIARPRLAPRDEETPGILDLDNPREGGYYTNANRLVTLLDNHDLDQRIMSHARLKHPGSNREMPFKVNRLCLAFLFSSRGIPSLYYGTEVGLEGWKNGEDDSDLRRDFPWHLFKQDTIEGGSPTFSFLRASNEESEEEKHFKYLVDLINMRKKNSALKYGNMITLWIDHYVFAFLRYHRDNVVISIFNNGYQDMLYPLDIPIIRQEEKFKIKQILPDRVIDIIENNNMTNWFDTVDKVKLIDSKFSVNIKGKSFKIYTINNDETSLY